MKYIEVEYNDVGERANITIYLINILYVREYKEKCRIYLANGSYVPVTQSYQEVKDMIANASVREA